MSPTSRDVDVLLVSDLRFPGGTSHSIAAEVEALHGAGYRVGLVHLNGPLVARVTPINPALAGLVRSGSAALLLGRAPVTARLVVFRHPGVLQAAADQLPPISTDRAVVLANSGPRDARGRTVYDVGLADRAARESLGVEPLWAPIGPLVRDEIEGVVPGGRLMEQDWVNIIDVDAWAPPRPREGWAGDRPVIGRHSRPSAQKWPRDAATLTQVYPVDGSWDVRVLGGADPVERPLRGIPRAWTVTEFGELSPRTFLQGLDFFVYYHDPHWVEAFGRTILEALAAGAVAVLPPHFRRLFGDAAVYAEPAGVREVVEGLRADRAAYVAQRDRARALVRERFSYQAHVARVADLIGTPHSEGGSDRPESSSGEDRTAPAHAVGEAAAAPATRHTPAVRRPGGPRILLMSSNGAGMGHLTRLFSYATRLEPGVSAHVVSLSQAAPLAGRLGLSYEYLPSAKALSMPPGRWRPIFQDRLGDALNRFDPDVVVFDGTWPYGGMEEIRAAHPEAHWTWSRRAMWREGRNSEQLAKTAWFDSVLEPGDLAAAYDRGATVTAEAHRVGPVTLVDAAELQPREQARAALSLPADGPLALVSLGAGNINDTTSEVGAAVHALTGLGVGVCVTVPGIARAGAAAGEDLHLVRDYPLSRRYSAFDVVISAAGYNSFHELLRMGVPTLFVPNTETSLDDQEARARFAADQGWAHQLPQLSVETATPLLEDLLDRGRTMAARAREADPGNGALAAAQFLTEQAGGRS
ncbi:glycosyltransferase [Ornithinimicrobium cavernae]|uniref:glycosyltransferase n=1 Tax=Ornithinimicrobium cavernae TaxID=2666047 RepID=UPI001F42CF7A|nr:glycosyltransferase [Ornithinimicrobium cavernae]